MKKQPKTKYKTSRNRAVGLRRRGLSYNEIKKEIGIAKSTLSSWLKGVKLKPEHQKRLYTKQIEILSRGPQSQKERRQREVEKIITKAEKEIKLPLSRDTLRLVGAALYWAEGSKGKLMQITNSDPHLILFVVNWIKAMFGISPKELKARLNIYPQQNETKIKKFWSDLANIPLKSFGKSYIKPLSKGYKKNNLYYGTVRIDVPKSTDLQYQVFGWIKGTLKDIEKDVRITKHKWRRLTKVVRPANLDSDNPS